MVPFRVFDRENKQTWIVINYHPATDAGSQGSYLMAQDDDSELDGKLKIITADDFVNFKFVDFIEEIESGLE